MEIKNLLVQSSPFLFDVAALVLRLFMGICFVVHGLGKLGVVGIGNMAGFESWLGSLGLPFPRFQARAAMAFEISGGIMMTIGLFTRIGAVMCLTTMIVAALVGHKGGGYLITNNPPGNEYAINLGVVLVAMILIGPGIYSLDAYLF
ncbi:MAG: hypothetical protein A2622_07270 [Bdellovibrionales bacterium RIFCSPHIGHO2_01_FULL_40_29]|nr:MAG: hypothetical protein A2622_07270 [Bdellovibrionales bacterium RIFCSPHIGHO2_01_FULL_40_29]OFZ33203.1 MAG: hypothetical protein A3D17_11510 [Bdellovibrionales bacterium RIFCSPHIGHO2_02_FULL_40_15]